MQYDGKYANKMCAKREARALCGVALRGYVYGNDGVTEIPHSIIILSTDLKGINYYQANVGGKCLVSTGYKTWDEFADWFFKTTGAWVA